MDEIRAEHGLNATSFDVIDTAVTAHLGTQERLVSGLSERDQRQLNSLVKRFLEDFETE